VKFTSKEGKQEHVWATSWGVSTRLMGALVMTHSDDHGLVLPPKLAPFQVVIVPIYKGEEQLKQISEKAIQIKKDLEKIGISVKFDNRDTHKPGWKFSEYEFKGVPLRIAIGPRDLENNTVELARRDTLEKETVSTNDLSNKISHLLDKIQETLLLKAQTFRDNNTLHAKDWDDFKELIKKDAGFVYAHWDGTAETEQKIKEETKATIRCIPLNNKQEEGLCIYSQKTSTQKVIFAKAY
jgi:prolyl-tRNA synthetase